MFWPACTARQILSVLDRPAADVLKGAGIVILSLGSGDAMRKSLDRLPTDFRMVLDRLRNKRVLVFLAPPMNENVLSGGPMAKVTNDDLARSRKIMAAICLDYSNVTALDITPLVADANGQTRPTMLDDTIHFTVDGYDVLWALIRKAILSKGVGH